MPRYFRTAALDIGLGANERNAPSESMTAAQLVQSVTHAVTAVRNEPGVEARRLRLESAITAGQVWLEAHPDDPDRQLVTRVLKQGRKVSGFCTGLFDAIIRTPGAMISGRQGALMRLWNPPRTGVFDRPVIRGVIAGSVIFGLTGLLLVAAEASTPPLKGEEA